MKRLGRIAVRPGELRPAIGGDQIEARLDLAIDPSTGERVA